MTELERIYNTYFNDVYRYILRLSGDEKIAEEITGDTFFRAMGSIDGFRGECDIRVWLCQIAKNCYYSQMRKNSREELADEKELEELPDPSSGVAEEYLRRERIAAVHRVLQELRAPYREVFMWRVYAELSFAQIGQIFGKSENWACVTYHRARKLIRDRLEDGKREK